MELGAVALAFQAPAMRVCLESGRGMGSGISTLKHSYLESNMHYTIFRKFLAVLFGLVLTVTGLWASPAEEEQPAAAMEKEMVTPHYRQDGDRAGRGDANHCLYLALRPLR